MITFLDKRQRFCEEIVNLVLSTSNYERCWFQCASTYQFSPRESSCPDLSKCEFLKDRLLVHFGYSDMIMSYGGLRTPNTKRTDHLILDIDFEKLSIQVSNLKQSEEAGSIAMSLAQKLFRKYFPLKFVANKYSV